MFSFCVGVFFVVVFFGWVSVGGFVLVGVSGLIGLFLWCAGVRLYLLYVCPLYVYWWVAGVMCVGVVWGYGCGVLVFCFWRFLCLLVVVFCLVLVL